MKYLTASLICLIIFAATGFTKELTRTIDPIQIIAPDGSHYNTAVTATVTKLTEQSYIMNLYDKDGKLLARDRRFLIQTPVNLQPDKVAYIKGVASMIPGVKP